MDKEKKPAQDMGAMMTQGVEQARGAMENYLKFFQNSMSAMPWASTELNKKLTDCARRNVDAAFAHAQNLTQAKDLQDSLRIQTEFFQSQLRSLTEQAKDIGDSAANRQATFVAGGNPVSGQSRVGRSRQHVRLWRTCAEKGEAALWISHPSRRFFSVKNPPRAVELTMWLGERVKLRLRSGGPT